MPTRELLQRITADEATGKATVHGIDIAQIFQELAVGTSKSQLMEKFPKLEYDDILACFAHAARLSQGKVEG